MQKRKSYQRCAKSGSCIVKAVLKRNVSDLSYINEEITNIPISFNVLAFDESNLSYTFHGSKNVVLTTGYSDELNTISCQEFMLQLCVM